MEARILEYLLQGIFPTQRLNRVSCIAVDQLPAEPQGNPIATNAHAFCFVLLLKKGLEMGKSFSRVQQNNVSFMKNIK